MSYAELQVTSNFSFLRGASTAEELVATAAVLGHKAIAVTDRNTLAGVVRAHAAVRQVNEQQAASGLPGIRLVVGARLDFADASSVLCFPTDRAAYGRLCRLLTLGKARARKGECRLHLQDLFDHGDGQRIIALPVDRPDRVFAGHLRRLKDRFGRAAYLAAHHLYRGDDARRLARLGELSDHTGLPLVATNDVHAHAPGRRPLQDVLTCIRQGCTIHDAGMRLFANAERHLKSPEEMARLFRHRPDAVHRTLEIAEACTFSLDELKYEYPVEPVPEGRSPQEELERLTWTAAEDRWPDGIPPDIRTTIAKELALIGRKDYAPYFLTVHDIVRYAREEKDILCQGRGSAANSIVCYVLGITAVDPTKVDLLFERFVSADRNEPPDIDVDFEHERREEVIQHIYDKYGRDRAALAATVISYRPKSAIRDVGKALGLSLDAVDALSKTVWGWGEGGINETYIREAGLDPREPTLRRAIQLARKLIGFPRHLSQHVGGFVITKGPLCEAVPIENAAMKDRTVIEWDKDDLDALGMLKIDVLALGMLTCLRKGFDLIERHHGKRYELMTVPQDEKPVYDMISHADTIGVFQVESRAQMSMLPRLRPRDFYDLVIEVAIVRPGPIQGDMVHPYLRRRDGKEKVDYPSPELETVLKKTLGVPLFQEQAMRIAIVAAGFAPSEADQLRRAMATFRNAGTIQNFRTKMVEGMVDRGYERDFAERCFNQIEGFGSYGFPESHAASFALLVYVSAWMKCRYPAVFACALLNSQPMGFYAPAQIVRDARDHGVEVRPVDVNHSDWDCTLEDGGRVLRLGFRQVKGLGQQAAERLVETRGAGFADPESLWWRSGLDPTILDVLAQADAFGSMGLTRRQGLWAVKRLGQAPLPLFSATVGEFGREPEARLPRAGMGEEVLEDYHRLRLTLKSHPLALLRPPLAGRGVTPNRDLAALASEAPVTVAGLVLIRQRPGTAKSVTFMTLEDETGVANIVVWARVFERFRRTVLRAELVAVEGRVQREGEVIHVIADRIIDLTGRLRALRADPPALVDGSPPLQARRLLAKSRDFH